MAILISEKIEKDAAEMGAFKLFGIGLRGKIDTFFINDLLFQEWRCPGPGKSL